MIGTGKQDGNWVEIYDENGNYKCCVAAHDGLVGYTGSTVSIKNGSWTEMYDENGNYQGCV